MFLQDRGKVTPNGVIPAKAGIQKVLMHLNCMDSPEVIGQARLNISGMTNTILFKTKIVNKMQYDNTITQA
jgi:hypothetical protein